MRYERNLQQWNFDAPKDSKLSNILITVYMCTILLFTAHNSLNIISLSTFVIAFGYCSFYMLMQGRIPRLNTFLLIFLAFVGFCFFSLLWSYDIDVSTTRFITIVQLFVMSVILCSYISYYDNIDVFILGLLISGLLCSTVVIGYYGFSEYIELMSHGARLGGPIANENLIGLYTGTTVVVSFYYGFIKGKKIGYVLLILPLIVVFGTGSRKALIMVATGIVLLIIMKYRGEITLKSFAKIIGCVLIGLLILNWLSTIPAFGTTFKRMSTMFGDSTGYKDNSAAMRETMIQAGWKYFKKNPYTGVGLGNTNIITWQYLGWETYLHNNYIELLSSVGIFGFALYYGMYLYLLKNLYQISVRTRDNTSILMFVIILTNFILEYGFVSYYNKMTYIYLAMAAATVTAGKRKMAEMEAAFDEYTEEGCESIERSEENRNILA